MIFHELPRNMYCIKSSASRTKVLAELVLDGDALGQLVRLGKVLVEAADQVDLGAGDGAARLAREQRVTLHNRKRKKLETETL